MGKLIKQIINFGIVGSLSFCIDYCLMIVFTEILGIYYFISSSLSFLISVSFNYICSMRFVFCGKKDISKSKEYFVFVMFSIVGLLINQFVMWFMVEKFNIYYAITKLFATVIVMIWNFVSRKLFLEKHR